MEIITKIKSLFSKKGTGDLAADVNFYPDKIIIQTFDFTDGPGVGSAKLTILSIDTLPHILGQTLRKHFNLTEHGLKYRNNKEAWNEYKKIAGFKTNKETYKDARNVTCRQTANEIVLIPTDNLSNTGYKHRTDLKIKLPITTSDSDLGHQLLKARELSKG